MIPSRSAESSLDKLIEECSEVIHVASKAKRFGISNYHPKTRRKNSDALLDKIMDLNEAIDDIKKYTPRPTVKEMADEVVDWFNNSTIRLQQEFTETDFGQLVIYHSSLGQQIRNRFNLWYYPWDERLVEGLDVSDEHPDAVSMRVIEEVWRRVNND